MTYTVWYRKTQCFFWKRINKIKGDDFFPNQANPTARIFVGEDETLYYIPVHDTVFKFSKERFYLIHKQNEQAVGRKLPVNSDAIPQ